MNETSTLGTTKSARAIQVLNHLYEFSIYAFAPTLFFWRGINSLVIRVGFASWLLLLILKAKPQNWKSLPNAFLMLFAFALAVSSASSPDRPDSFRAMLSLLDAFLLFVMVQGAPRDDKFWKRLGWITLTGIGIVGIDAITQKVFGTGIVSRNPLQDEPAAPARGPFTNSNNLIVLGLYLPCVVLLLKDRFSEKHILQKSAMLVLVSIAVCAAVFSKSRNVWISIGLFALMTGWIVYRWKGLLAGILILVGLTAALPQGRQTVARALNFDTQYSDRIQIWNSAIEIWRENPGFGIGMKMFPKLKRTDGNFDRSDQSLNKHHPHSFHLETLTETGVFGFASLWLLIGACVWRLWKIRHDDLLKHRFYFLGTSLALTLIAGFVDFSMRFRFYPYSLLFFCGMIVAITVPNRAGNDNPN